MTTPDWFDKFELNDDQWRELVRHRGGCSCHISPPCSACCEPITLQEAQELGFGPEEEEPPHQP